VRTGFRRLAQRRLCVIEKVTGKLQLRFHTWRALAVDPRRGWPHDLIRRCGTNPS
jgi:hypothetical protein